MGVPRYRCILYQWTHKAIAAVCLDSSRAPLQVPVVYANCTDCVPKKKSFRWTPGTRCLSQWSRSNTEFFQESKPDWRKRGPAACVVLNLHTGLVEWFRTHLSKPSPRTVLNTVQRRSFQRLSAPNGKKASSLIYGCILKVKVSTIDINLHTHRSHTC